MPGFIPPWASGPMDPGPDPLMGPGQLNDDQYAAHFRLQPIPMMGGCRWCSSTLLIRKGGFLCMGCDTPGPPGTLAADDPRLPPPPEPA